MAGFMNQLASLPGWSTVYSMRHVVNRSAIVPERSAMNVNFPAAINIKVFVHLAEGGLPVFTPGKAINIPRRSMRRKWRPSMPAGMKNYRACDYFCRQTYELLKTKFQFGNPSRFVLRDSCHN